jgi:hypothetical protein
MLSIVKGSADRTNYKIRTLTNENRRKLSSKNSIKYIEVKTKDSKFYLKRSDQKKEKY